MGSIFSPKKPDAGAMQAAQEAAAKKERDRLAAEQAMSDAKSENAAYAKMQDAQGNKRAFVSQVEGEDTSKRKRFLKPM